MSIYLLFLWPSKPGVNHLQITITNNINLGALWHSVESGSSHSKQCFNEILEASCLVIQPRRNRKVSAWKCHWKEPCVLHFQASFESDGGPHTNTPAVPCPALVNSADVACIQSPTLSFSFLTTWDVDKGLPKVWHPCAVVARVRHRVLPEMIVQWFSGSICR